MDNMENIENIEKNSMEPTNGTAYVGGEKKKKKGGFGTKIIKCIVLALVFGLVAGCTFQGVIYVSNRLVGDSATISSSILPNPTVNQVSDSDVNDGVLSQTKHDDTTGSGSVVTDVSGIVKDIMPAVVAVTNKGIVERNTWFGTYQQEYTSCGSGIIISQDDENIYIATNHHVISGAKTLSVAFNDETEAEGTVKGSDSSMDLAIIAIPLSEISTATRNSISVAAIGESESLLVGQAAVVIGNALGYGQSVTTGVISALNREVKFKTEDGSIMSNYLIQTDAAVNPGNSGGALLNINGEVIGIVSAKYSDTDVEGMGYAIPISEAFTILEQMIEKDVVSAEETAYLGIAGLDITSSNAQGNMPKGVYVTQVVAGSAADMVGIEKGDIITEFNGRAVKSMDSLSNIMKYLSAGTTVEIKVAKEADNYKEVVYKVTLTNRNIALTR